MARVSRWAAQGIGAEILFYRGAVKKIAAESPVFCGVSRKRCAQIPNYKWIFEQALSYCR
jgi:hypothetical protein